MILRTLIIYTISKYSENWRKVLWMNKTQRRHNCSITILFANTLDCLNALSPFFFLDNHIHLYFLKKNLKFTKEDFQ